MISHPEIQHVAVVGINKETPGMLQLLMEAEGVRVVRVINPETEDLAFLRTTTPPPNKIVNICDDPKVLDRLKSLEMKDVDILGGLSARILFSSGNREISTGEWSQDRTRVLSSLREVKQAVLLSKNKEELLKLLLQVAISTCRADTGSIMLVDARKRFLKIEMADGLNFDIVKSTTRRFGSGVAGKVARTGKPVLISGPMEGGVDGRTDLVSSICCPLIIGSEVVGVLNINSKSPQRVFTQKDLAYIKELADFTADVIKTSKEFETTTSSTFSLSLLNAAREILGMKYPFQERLNLLTMKIVNAFGGLICNYYQYSDDQKMFLTRASSSFNRDLLLGKNIKLNDTIAQKVLRSGATICLDVSDPDSAQRRWYIACPIKLNDSVRAILFLHLVSPRKDMAEESKLLQKISDMIGNELATLEEKQLLEMQSTMLVAVSEASFNIASASTLGALINFALPNACLIMEAEAGIFWLLDPVTDTLEIFSSFSIGDQVLLDELKLIDAQIVNKHLPGNDVVLIRDLRKEGFTSHESHPKSLLCKSFGASGQVAAVLSLYGKRSLDLFGSCSFTRNDQEVFLKFCLQFSKGLGKLMPYFDERR